jgi:hypothetical protein
MTLTPNRYSASRPIPFDFGGGEPSASIEQYAWRPQKGSKLFREEKKQNVVPGIEPRLLDFPARIVSPAPVATTNNGRNHIHMSLKDI